MAVLSRSRHDLMQRLADLRQALREYGIRDASDYAEALIAEAVEGERQRSRITKGFDVLAPRFGRIEVKCRQLPLDGRLEERVAITSAKEDGFEHLAILIFQADFSIKGAVIVPYPAVWEFVRDQQYNRISYSQACRLPGAAELTTAVQAAQNK